MRDSLRGRGAALAMVAVLAAGTTTVGAQSLQRRVDAAGDGSVQFHFAAREGVCGDGRSYLRAEDEGWYGTWSGNGMRDLPCTAGPVRVVISKSSKEIVRIEVQAGPLQVDPSGGQDLGAFGARESAAYLLELARSLDGRPARDAVLPAMLADSSVVTPGLAAIAKDQTRSRELRRSAISWLARRRAESGGVGPTAADKAIDQIIRDRTESESVRQSALSTISRLDRGEGVGAMLQLVRDNDQWLSKQAFANLARSGDPRARQFVRESVKRTDLPDENRLEALRALGNEYASGADIRALRELYPSSNNDRERETILSTVATAGGSENANWLLAIANSPTEPVSRRRRAITLLAKFDDPRVREALKGMIDKQ